MPASPTAAIQSGRGFRHVFRFCAATVGVCAVLAPAAAASTADETWAGPELSSVTDAGVPSSTYDGHLTSSNSNDAVSQSNAQHFNFGVASVGDYNGHAANDHINYAYSRDPSVAITREDGFRATYAGATGNDPGSISRDDLRDWAVSSGITLGTGGTCVVGNCHVGFDDTLTTAQLAVMTARAADFNRRRFLGVGGTPRPRSPWMRTVNSRLSTVPAPSPQDITISAATGAADICAEDHISGGHGSIVWDYDRRQADLDAWTAANGLTCCPTAVWHAYLDDGGSGFWSDAERGWWPQLDRWEAARRAYNAAVNDYNARVTAYNTAVTAYNAQANAYNTSNTGSRPTFSGTHPGSPPSRHPGPMPRFVNSTVYADYANKDQGPLGCYPALLS